MNYKIIKTWMRPDSDLPCIEAIRQDIAGVIFVFESIEFDVTPEGEVRLWYDLSIKKNDVSELPADFDDLAQELIFEIWEDATEEQDDGKVEP